MKFKRLSILFILMLALSTFFSSFAFAENTDKPNLVALGDSITFGWNLDGPTNAQPSLKAFPYLIDGGAFNVTNISGGGWTSANILASVNNPANEAAIRNANVFTLDIGSNDLMQAVGLPQIIANGTPVDPAELQPKVLAASAQLAQNLQLIFGKIRALNPTAPIIFYNLYNPFGASEDPFPAFLHIVGEQIVAGVNGVNTKVIAHFASVPGTFIANTYSVFNGKQSTFIIPGDIHPTTAGHAALASLATQILASLVPVPKEITIELKATPSEETTGPVTIEVSTSAEEVLSMKWLTGEKVAADFEDAGTDIIGNKFEVTENGTYTVYVMDNHEVSAVKTISIENIKAVEQPKEDPKPTPTPTPTPTTPKTPTKPPVVKGHVLPNTASPVYNYFAIGFALILGGLITMKIQNRRRENI